ncbi:MAG: YjhX family toxin, partial [Pseudomonadota bacterium]
KIHRVIIINRDGWRAPGLDLRLFRKLKRRRAIASRQGQPYRITRRGLELVRSEVDNR